jgi:hypothetical protein
VGTVPLASLGHRSAVAPLGRGGPAAGSVRASVGPPVPPACGPGPSAESH